MSFRYLLHHSSPWQKKKKKKEIKEKKQSLFRDVKSFIQKKCPKIYMEICGKEEFK